MKQWTPFLWVRNQCALQLNINAIYAPSARHVRANGYNSTFPYRTSVDICGVAHPYGYSEDTHMGNLDRLT